MSERINLHERFLRALSVRYPRKLELAVLMEDLLRIERESAYRRLRGDVQFTIEEMGLIASELRLSLDGLLEHDMGGSPVHLRINVPRANSSLEPILHGLRMQLECLEQIGGQPDAELGTVLSVYPTEFYAPYASLTKFLYFKWHYYHVGGVALRDYASWELPEEVRSCHERMLLVYRSLSKVFYIWNPSLMRNLMDDIRYFSSIGILTADELSKVKADLHASMNDLEQLALTGLYGTKTLVEIYVSYVDIGLSYRSLYSSKFQASYFFTFFISSAISENSVLCRDVHRWLNSLKNISTLITRSGEKERILFFRRQHAEIDKVS